MSSVLFLTDYREWLDAEPATELCLACKLDEPEPGTMLCTECRKFRALWSQTQGPHPRPHVLPGITCVESGVWRIDVFCVRGCEELVGVMYLECTNQYVAPTSCAHCMGSDDATDATPYTDAEQRAIEAVAVAMFAPLAGAQ